MLTLRVPQTCFYDTFTTQSTRAASVALADVSVRIALPLIEVWEREEQSIDKGHDPNLFRLA